MRYLLALLSLVLLVHPVFGMEPLEPSSTRLTAVIEYSFWHAGENRSLQATVRLDFLEEGDEWRCTATWQKNSYRVIIYKPGRVGLGVVSPGYSFIAGEVIPEDKELPQRYSYIISGSLYPPFSGDVSDDLILSGTGYSIFLWTTTREGRTIDRRDEKLSCVLLQSGSRS